MNIKQTKQAIETMQAFVEGKQIEVDYSGEWREVVDPLWNWFDAEYRVMEIKPSINWDHVSPEWKWMATDKAGHTYLFNDLPPQGKTGWWGPRINCTIASSFASFNPGNCDWKDSLVERPG